MIWNPMSSDWWNLLMYGSHGGGPLSRPQDHIHPLVASSNQIDLKPSSSIDSVLVLIPMSSQ